MRRGRPPIPGFAARGPCRRRPGVEPLEPRALLATIVVSDAGDAVAVDGVVTLREAILAANANAPVGDAPAGDGGGVVDRIAFHVPGGGVQTIRPTTPLPTITDPVVIDAYTQPGARPNALAVGDDAAIRIVLDLSRSNSIAAGLRIEAGGSTVRGLRGCEGNPGTRVGRSLPWDSAG